MLVSCQGIARVYDEKTGHYCLMLDTSDESGPFLRPIGGGLRPDELSKKHLVRNLHASGFRDGDSTFELPPGSQESVIQWFLQALGRQTSVLPPMIELLVDWLNIVSLIDLADAQESHSCFHSLSSPGGDIALALVETITVNLGTTALWKLRRASTLAIEERWVHFVSGGEIKQGVTDDGLAIDRIASCLT